MKRIIFFFPFVFTLLQAYSQPAPTKSDSLRKDALNVFMSANDYIKKEIPFVNYVRDIKEAGVYVISTTQRTGSGGYEYSYFLVGQNGNAGMTDTITFVTSPDETQDEIRIKEVKTLKMGLLRYVARTPLSQYVNISFSEPMSETVSGDKWNSWVFRTSLSGRLNGEQTYKQTNLSGDFSAARITENWKINMRARYNSSKQAFEIDGGETVLRNNSKSFNSLVVRSINDHWSYGGSAYLGSASYSNEHLEARIMPGLEYDLFPYSQSTRKQLRFLYTIGYSYVMYSDTTIYEKMKEGHFQHSFNLAYEVVQKWGSVDVSLNYSNYLHDWSKNNLSLNGFLSLRVAKGLNVNIGGEASLIHDQLGLVKRGATAEEILTRRKEVATQFDYFTSFGFTYTFGSIYNNVVNPRFGNSGGGGGGMMIMY